MVAFFAKTPGLVIRVDDRLLHGQVVIGWGNNWPAKEIWLACDRVANDEDERLLYEPLLPDHIQGGVVTLKQAIDKWSSADSKIKRILLVVESCEDLLVLVENGIIPDEAHIGSLGAKAGRIPQTASVHIGNEDLEILKKVKEHGVITCIHELPGNKPTKLNLD